MAENKKKFSFGRPVRVMVLATALTAALGISAFAASPAGQEFIENVKLSVFVVTEPNEDGTLDVTQVDLPDVNIDRKDGHTLFTVDGQEMDITEELAKEEEFTFRSDRKDGGYWLLKVDADGHVKATGYDEKGAEQLTVDLLDDTDVSYAFSINSEEMKENEDFTSTYKITGDEEGGISLEDEKGNVVHYDSLDDIPVPALKD
ncbi:MAG: hypothetical protein HFF04_08250 [Oscillospiraceae bacterium]|nr:hypothetical protein [Oscillospiraceae bacterium]